MMPASKHGDPQLGIDIHMCAVPPSPSGVPLPVPHLSVVFDPFDYIPILGATITVCGMKRATAGTSGLVIHIPPGFPILPVPKPPERDDELFMGSATVVADGDPMSHIVHPVLACQIAGMPSIPRLKKKGPKRMMLLPLTVNLAIPTNVFIGGPPTISLLGLAMKGAFAALGKFAKSGVFKRVRQKLFKNMNPGFLKCSILRAEPVNILTGQVSIEHRDFVLPGRLPIEWNRSYDAGNTREGLCGPGWLTPADAHLTASEAGVVVHYPGVGPLHFDALPEAEGAEHAEIELIDGATLIDHGSEFRVRTKADLVYHFPKAAAAAGYEGAYEIAISAIADRCGNRLDFERVNGRLVAINESSGRRLEVAVYQNRLRAVGLQLPGSEVPHMFVSYDYDSEGHLIAVRDALQHSYTFEYAAQRMVRHTDRIGLSFYYKYDDSQRVVRSWGDGGLYNYKFEYLDAVNERRITNSLGHVSIVKLDERGLPLSEIDALGGMTIYEYDDAGRTIGVTNQDGHRTGFTYDERGNLRKLERADGSQEHRQYDANNKPVVIVDPAGGKWQQEWDARGQLVAQTTPLGRRSSYEHDERGQLVALVGPRGARTELTLDPAGHVIAVRDPVGRRTQYAYDILSNVVGKQDALGQRTLFRYDAKSRLVGAALPSGSQLSCAYDAEDNLVRYVDENGAATELEYFGQGAIAKRRQPDGHSVHYRYDTEEQLTGIVNQRGELFELKRDPLGRLAEEVDYWGQARRYEYTAAGRLRRSIDPLAQVIDFETDPLGQILAKQLRKTGASEPDLVETFEYDPNGNLVACENPHVRVERKYDGEGRMLEERQGQHFVIANTHDEAGNRTSRATRLEAHGSVTTHRVRYAYDIADQLTAVTIDERAPIELERDALGRIVNEQLHGALTRDLEYTTDNLVAKQRVSNEAGPVIETSYAYDRVGNLIERNDHEFGADQYRYDPMGRVLEHLDPQGRLRTFLNDPAGDRLATRVVEEHPTLGGEALSDEPMEWFREGTAADGAFYRFDRAGNLILRRDERGELTLAWDANRRLRESQLNGVETAYRYDPLGRRIAKETHGTANVFGWDNDALAVSSESADSTRSAREWVYYPSSYRPLAMLVGDPGAADGCFNYHNDPNGCPIRLTDGHGQIRWSARYEAWGETSRAEGTIDNPLRLQGQYADAETGLYFNRCRYFEPRLGSFVSHDPAGVFLAGENPYAFGPNAQRWIDPLGLKCTPTAKRMQELVDQAVADITANPALARDLMSHGSYMHLVNRTGLHGASFGKAVERRTAELVAADAKLARSIKHTGRMHGPDGRFVSSPDFTGRREVFDVTTNRAVPAHAARYGDTPVTYLTYDVPSGVEFPR